MTGMICKASNASSLSRESLGDADTLWVRATEQKVFALLRETPPDGEQFVEIIKKILKVITILINGTVNNETFVGLFHVGSSMSHPSCRGGRDLGDYCDLLGFRAQQFDITHCYHDFRRHRGVDSYELVTHPSSFKLCFLLWWLKCCKMPKQKIAARQVVIPNIFFYTGGSCFSQ